MGKTILLAILTIVLVASGCTQPPANTPISTSESAETPPTVEITEQNQTPFAMPKLTSLPPEMTTEMTEQKSAVEEPQTSDNTQPIESPWPMFRGNRKHTGLSPYDTSHIDGTVKWTFTVEDDFESSPSIGADGTVYIASHNNNLYAINPDGTEKWRFDAGDPVYDEKYGVWKGILSSPAIASDGTIYISSLSNFLIAINPDGQEMWRFPLKTSVDNWSSPTIGVDGTIYIGSARDSTGGKIYAINPDGTEKWSFATESDVFPSPAIGDDGTIYFGSWDNNVYALNPDGTEKWHFVTEGKGIVSSPAIGRDGTIHIVANDSNLYAIRPDGTEKWRLFLGKAIETASSPTIGADGTIYIGFPWTAHDTPTFRTISPDGAGKWTFMTKGGISASPAIGKDGTVFISSYNGVVYAFGGASVEAKGATTETSGATFPPGGPEPIFTVSPVDINRIAYIIPFGNLNLPAHVFPTDHMYFYMTRPMHRATLYSSGDLTITSITTQEHTTASLSDYTITLKASDDITIEFGHVNSPLSSP